MHKPIALSEGDLIYIVSPAKSIEAQQINHAKKTMEDWGYKVEISKHASNRCNYFSGSDNERLSQLNWSGFKTHPKWIVGFSDITVFHLRCAILGIMSLHATMPLNFSSNSKEALSTLDAALSGKIFEINAPPSSLNKEGVASGKLIGGNLSIIFSLLGTQERFEFEEGILFLEDLSEQLYHLDRMFFALKKAGVFNKINGLIVGGMTDLKDTTPSFGMTYEEIILEKMEGIAIPICFNFPSGHIDDNRAMILGAPVEIEVNSIGVKLRYI